MSNVLKTTMQHYDGGYVMCGLTGSGEMFSIRDPWGIRPAFYYRNDEIIALASERPVLQTTFDLQTEEICELLPGQALIVHKNGESRLEQILPVQKLSACSFERMLRAPAYRRLKRLEIYVVQESCHRISPFGLGLRAALANRTLKATPILYQKEEAESSPNPGDFFIFCRLSSRPRASLSRVSRASWFQKRSF